MGQYPVASHIAIDKLMTTNRPRRTNCHEPGFGVQTMLGVVKRVHWHLEMPKIDNICYELPPLSDYDIPAE